MEQQATMIISTKDGEVEFPQQVIDLIPKQLEKLNQRANEKTSNEWLDSSRGIRIKMTEEQKKQVLKFKDDFINRLVPSRSAKDLLDTKRIGFSEHAFERIDERFLEYYRDWNEQARGVKEKLGFEVEDIIYEAASIETMTEILEIFIKSDDIDDFFVWKAYPYLSYKFKGYFRSGEIGIVIMFSKDTTIITITT